MTRTGQNTHPQRLLRIPIAAVAVAYLVVGLAGCGSQGGNAAMPGNSGTGGAKTDALTIGAALMFNALTRGLT